MDWQSRVEGKLIFETFLYFALYIIQCKSLLIFVFLGFIVDYFGRRMAIIINSVLFLVGAIILALAPSFAVLVSLLK